MFDFWDVTKSFQKVVGSNFTQPKIYFFLTKNKLKVLNNKETGQNQAESLNQPGMAVITLKSNN